MPFLVDCGSTSLTALKAAGLDPGEIGTVFVSHLHGDHFGGLPYLVLDGQFRGRTEGNETEIVEGDLVDIESCDALLGDFSEPDEGTAMEAWYAHGLGRPVIAYTAGRAPHPWTVYVAHEVHADLEDAVRALSG